MLMRSMNLEKCKVSLFTEKCLFKLQFNRTNIYQAPTMLEALRKILGSKHKKIRKFYLQAPKNLLFSKKTKQSKQQQQNPAKTKTKQQ